MNIGNRIAVLGSAVLLTISVGLAQTKPAPAKAAKVPASTKATTTAMHVMNGTVESVSGSGPSMTVIVKGTKSTDKPVTLMLDSSTTRTGDLVQGAKVNAHYHVENGQNIATSITASAVKTKASAKTTSAAKK